jgi:trimethylamine:corrinoid methyltransferase-like protein
MPGWTEAKGSSMGDRIKEKVQGILANHQVPALPDDVLQQLEANHRQGRRKRSGQKET